jgi:hypothetical protein
MALGAESYGDVIDPYVTNTLSTPSTTTTAITWTTDEGASTKLDYGLTDAYGETTIETDTSPRTTSHTVDLASLVECTTYHYRVRSIDDSTNEVVGTDNTFTTDCIGDAAVSSQTAASITSAVGGSVSLLSASKGIVLTIPVSFAGSNAEFQTKQLASAAV